MSERDPFVWVRWVEPDGSWRHATYREADGVGTLMVTAVDRTVAQHTREVGVQGADQMNERDTLAAVAHSFAMQYGLVALPDRPMPMTYAEAAHMEAALLSHLLAAGVRVAPYAPMDTVFAGKHNGCGYERPHVHPENSPEEAHYLAPSPDAPGREREAYEYEAQSKEPKKLALGRHRPTAHIYTDWAGVRWVLWVDPQCRACRDAAQPKEPTP